MGNCEGIRAPEWMTSEKRALLQVSVNPGKFQARGISRTEFGVKSSCLVCDYTEVAIERKSWFRLARHSPRVLIIAALQPDFATMMG
jgi:hypothetical protein